MRYRGGGLTTRAKGVSDMASARYTGGGGGGAYVDLSRIEKAAYLAKNWRTEKHNMLPHLRMQMADQLAQQQNRGQDPVYQELQQVGDERRQSQRERMESALDDLNLMRGVRGTKPRRGRAMMRVQDEQDGIVLISIGSRNAALVNTTDFSTPQEHTPEAPTSNFGPYDSTVVVQEQPERHEVPGKGVSAPRGKTQPPDYDQAGRGELSDSEFDRHSASPHQAQLGSPLDQVQTLRSKLREAEHAAAMYVLVSRLSNMALGEEQFTRINALLEDLDDHSGEEDLYVVAQDDMITTDQELTEHVTDNEISAYLQVEASMSEGEND